MKKKIVDWFNGLPLQQKNKVIRYGIIGVVALLIAVIFFSSMTKKAEQKQQQKKESGQKEIQIDQNLLDKAAYLETNKEMQDLKDRLTKIEKGGGSPNGGQNQITPPGTQAQTPPVMNEMKAAHAASNTSAVNQKVNKQGQAQVVPPPPPPPQQMPPQASVNVRPPPVPGEQTRETIGGIETVKNTEAKLTTEEAKDVKKKNRTIYIPAGTIIPVTLLSGVDATCMEDAKRPNVPVLLRVDNLAFLPNEFKANLKGCRILAQGIGSLADERVHLRGMSMTCISKTGKALVESEIQGYLADTDGKGGVRGTVVSKMDSALWRAFLAGLFGGAGDAIRSTSQPLTTVSVGGTTGMQTLNPSQIGQAGVGGGLSTASAELQRFYMDLARQLSPTIEIGALVKLAFITTKGAELEIKTMNLVR